MIKGKLLWWRSGIGSGITTLAIETVAPGMETPGRVVHVEVDVKLFRKFFGEVGNPARKTIIYENGMLKLE